MGKTSSRRTCSVGTMAGTNVSRFVAAAIIYAAFAVYLYQPHFKHFNTLRYLVLVNVCLASLGCYILSRRWITGFAESFFAGAIYGFGPFVLWLNGYHPTVGFLAATIPWLFCPAAFSPKTKWRRLSRPFLSIPFLGIILFFQVSAYYHLFAMPIHARLHTSDLASLLTPLTTISKGLTPVSFYHIPIAMLIMGFSMLLAARRFSIIGLIFAGTGLAFCDSFFNISPVIWLVFPILCGSVLIGAGMQGLVSAGPADQKWVLMTALVMAVLSLVTLQLARGYSTLFAGAAKIYIAGTITLAAIFFLTVAQLRMQWLRLIILCCTITADVVFSASFIVDRIF